MDIVEIKAVMKKIAGYIADKRFDLLYRDDYKQEVPEDALRKAVEEYGDNFTRPPDEAFDKMTIYTIFGDHVAVDVRLWYEDERSDLTVSATLRVIDGELRYTIENIRIL
jgi:hypothetical protein